MFHLDKDQWGSRHSHSIHNDTGYETGLFYIDTHLPKCYMHMRLCMKICTFVPVCLCINFYQLFTCLNFNKTWLNQYLWVVLNIFFFPFLAKMPPTSRDSHKWVTRIVIRIAANYMIIVILSDLLFQILTIIAKKLTNGIPLCDSFTKANPQKFTTLLLATFSVSTKWCDLICALAIKSICMIFTIALVMYVNFLLSNSVFHTIGFVIHSLTPIYG